MNLRIWALSTSNGGARSPANYQFVDGLVHRGSLAAVPGMAISTKQVDEQGIPCTWLYFHLPQVYHSTGVTSIPVLVPTATIGTGLFQPTHVFYSLLEEIIGWMAGAGSKHTLVRLYQQNQGGPLVHSYSSDWQLLHGGIASFISSLRQPNTPFPSLGRITNSYGAVDVTQAMTPSGQVSADYVVRLTLNDGRRMSLYLPRGIAKLTKDWCLDWLEIQNQFSNRVQ